MAVLAGLAALGAYVTLPWWLPTSLLRDRLEGQIGRQVRLDCRIRSVKVSWSDGVRIEGFSLTNPKGFGPGSMISVERIRADFSPLRMLFEKRLGWVELTGCRVAVELDADGRLNVEALRGLSFDLQADRTTVHGALVTMVTPDLQVRWALRVQDLQMVTPSAGGSGRLTLSGMLVQRGRVAPVVIQAATGVDRPFAVASASIRFDGVDLAQMSLPQAMQLPLEALCGFCSGTIDLQLDRRLVVNRFSVDLRAKRLSAQPVRGPRIPVIDQARLRLAAKVDLLNHKIDCSSLDVRLPGVQISGSASVFTEILQGSWQAVESVRLAGKIWPGELSSMLTGEQRLGGQVQLQGPLDVNVAAKRNGSELALDVQADATQSEIRRAERLLKASGVVLRGKLAGTLDQRDWTFKADSALLEAGRNKMAMSGTMRQANRIVRRLIQGGGAISPRGVLAGLGLIDSAGRWEIREPRTLVQMLGGAPVEHWVELEGALRGSWHVANAPDGTRVQVTARVPVGVKLSVAGVLAKPADVPIEATFGAVLSGGPKIQAVHADVSVGEGRISIEQVTATLDEPLPDDGGWELLAVGRYRVEFLEAILAVLPRLGRAGVDGFGRASGDFEVVLSQRASRSTMRLDVRGDLTDSSLSWRDLSLTLPGQSGRVGLAVRRSADGTTGRDELAISAEFPAVRAVLDLSRRRSDRVDAVRAKLWLADAELALAALREAGRSLDGWDASGRACAEFQGRYLAGELAGTLSVDLSKVGFRGNGAIGRKRKGVPLKLRVSGRLKVSSPLSQVSIAESQLKFGDSAVGLTGRVDFDPPELLRRLSGRVRLDLHADQPFSALLPTAASWAGAAKLQGVVDFDARRDGGRTWSVRVRFEDLAGLVRGKDVLLDGPVACTGVGVDETQVPKLGGFSSEGLRFRLGATAGWLVAELHDVLRATSGRVYLLFDFLDDKELTEFFASRQAGRPGLAGLSDSQAAELLYRADGMVSVLREAAAKSDLQAWLAADRYRTYDSSVDEFYDLRCLDARAKVAGGRAMIVAKAGLNGGCYVDTLSVDLTGNMPVVLRKTRITDVKATDNIQPQIAKFFPGNTVRGYFNRTQDVQIPLRDLVAHAMDARYVLRPVGTGLTVTTDGQVQGRAAPKFVTAVFPGLNLAHYRYQKMTSFSEFLPDGTAVNDMIFNGRSYDIYMEGSTSPDNIGEYDIGLILLSASPQWQHQWKQGRIPILKFKGRIEGGKIHDEQVSYFWPNETLFIIFLRNNVFYRMWLNTRGKTTRQLSAGS